jgi:hypothetical protein
MLSFKNRAREEDRVDQCYFIIGLRMEEEKFPFISDFVNQE